MAGRVRKSVLPQLGCICRGDFMTRIVGIWLFTFLVFLLWLYLAANHSTAGDWWTVKTSNKITVKDKDITPISKSHFISRIKVLIGSVVFLSFGTFLSFLVRKRRQ